MAPVWPTVRVTNGGRRLWLRDAGGIRIASLNDPTQVVVVRWEGDHTAGACDQRATLAWRMLDGSWRYIEQRKKRRSAKGRWSSEIRVGDPACVAGAMQEADGKVLVRLRFEQSRLSTFDDGSFSHWREETQDHLIRLEHAPYFAPAAPPPAVAAATVADNDSQSSSAQPSFEMSTSPDERKPTSATSMASDGPGCLPEVSPKGDGSALRADADAPPTSFFARTLLGGRAALLQPTPRGDGGVFLDDDRRQNAFARKLRGGLEETSSEAGCGSAAVKPEPVDDALAPADESDESDADAADDGEHHDNDGDEEPTYDESDHEPDEYGDPCDCWTCEEAAEKAAAAQAVKREADARRQAVDAQAELDERLIRGCLEEAMRDYGQTVGELPMRAALYGAKQAVAIMTKREKRRRDRAAGDEGPAHELANGGGDNADNDGPLDELALSPLIKRLQAAAPMRRFLFAMAKPKLRRHDVAGDVVATLGVDGLRQTGVSLGVAASIVEEVAKDRAKRRRVAL